MTNMNERPCGAPHAGVDEVALKDKCARVFELKKLRGIPLADCFRACGTGDLQVIAGMTRELKEVEEQANALGLVLKQLNAFKREKFDAGDEQAMRISHDEMRVYRLWLDLTEIENALHSAHAVAHVVLKTGGLSDD
ncbi:hypothetical protein [Sutterella sp.]|uniref:hypothetical protein n=1 Tax=Sutterella sp. TaxID=1981025 RepID=UPI003FD8E03C